MALQDVIASILSSSLGTAFKDIVGSLKADPTVVAELQTSLAEKQIELQGKLIDQITAQIAVDQAEAQSKNWWVAGWRPAVGWVCVVGLFYQFLLCPLGTAFSAMAHHPVAFPTLPIESLMTLLGGMLGISITGTVEKVTRGDSNAH